MPPVIAAGLAGATGLAATSFTLVAASNVIFAGVLFAAQYALQSRSKAGPIQGGRREPAQSTVRLASGPRSRSYGTVKTGGTAYFFGTAKSIAAMGVAFESGPIDSYLGYYFGTEQATISAGDNISSGRMAGWGSMHPTPGARGPGYPNFGVDDSGFGFNAQPAISFIPTYFPDVFGATDHILKGIAHVQMIFDRPAASEIQAVFPQGFPQNFRAERRGARVWDPRTAQGSEPDSPNGDWYNATWTWSDNPALCILDYIRCPDGGWGKPLSRIELATFEDAADICDGLVTKHGVTTEKRYRCAGTYYFDEPRSQVLGRLLATCDGDIYKTTDGRLALRLGEFGTPAVTFGRNEMADIRLSYGAGQLDVVNHVIPKFTDPNQDYQLNDAEIVRDTASIAAVGEKSQELALDWVPSSSQAHRLARRWMRRQNPPRRLVFGTGPVGALAAGEPFIGIDLPAWGIDGAVFQVIENPVSSDLSAASFDLQEVTAATFDEGPPAIDPDYDPGEPTPTGIPVPAAPLVVVGQETAGGAATLFLVAAANVPDDLSLVLAGHYRRAGDSIWIPYSATEDPYVVQSGTVSDQTVYQSELWFRDPVGRIGPKTAVISTTANPPTYEAETTALLARMSVQPSVTQAARINTFIRKLKNGGIWTKLDAVYLLAGHTAQAARLNLKGATFDLTQTGTVTFVAERGFTGDGSTGYHGTGFTPSTAPTPQFTLNSSHMGVWILNNATSNGYDIGAQDSAILTRTLASLLSTHANALSQTVAMSSSAGHSLWARASSTAYARYKNGAALAAVTQNSSAVATFPILIGARNHQTTISYGVRQVAAAHFGASLSAAEVTTLYNALNSYLASLGAV